MNESDLSRPVTEYFESLGYAVNCEVNGIDVVAHKDTYLIAIELKLTFNMKLLFQVMDRLKFVDEAYVALPAPKRRSKDLTKIRQLAEKLNFGVLLVHTGVAEYVDVLHVPISRNNSRDNKRKRRAAKEVEGRSVELNKGGVTRVKIVTAYREKCIAVVAIMHIHGDIKIAELRESYGFDKDIGRVLGNDRSKWFERVEIGRYKATEKAQNDILATSEFKRLFDAYLEKYQ